MSASSSNFYSSESPEEQSEAIARAESQSQELAPNSSTVINEHGSANGDDAADDGSSEDMDVSVSSRFPSPDQAAGAKRKRSDAQENIADLAWEDNEEAPKRLKVSSLSETDGPVLQSKADSLPPALWQHVFSYLPPAMLGRCLSVCRKLNSYLTNTKAETAPAKRDLKVRVLDSEAIWARARKKFLSYLPRPLTPGLKENILPGLHYTELQMLQLIGGRRCQFCYKDPQPVPNTTPFNGGPGDDGVRVVWVFGVRSCGVCLAENTIKDIDILQSSARLLMPCLPPIYLTKDHHFVSENKRKGMPPGASKVFSRRQMNILMQDYNEAVELENVENWRKGLPDKRDIIVADAARWENWECQLRRGTNLWQALREYDPSSFPHYFETAQSRSNGPNVAQSMVASNGPHMLPQPVQAFPGGFGTNHPMSMPQSLPQHRYPRDINEVNQAKQARKEDIERRCMELDPPLERNVLQHIEAFKTSIQMSTPMTDDQWIRMKPVLEAQREAAEAIERQKQEDWALLEAATVTVPPKHGERTEKEEKEYTRAQEPLRKKLGEYAESYIRNQWHGGQGLDQRKTPIFAAQILLHVRERYLQDKQSGLLEFPAPPARTGSREASPPVQPFLSLDNMKYVFDYHIRPYVEQAGHLPQGREVQIFVCNGAECLQDKRPKLFAFEGLIQHYGAKHTNAFSKGNVVVHWQSAEWPDESPFHPNPSNYIKPDRKSSDFKHQGRTRSANHGAYEEPFSNPAPGQMGPHNPAPAQHYAITPQGFYPPPAGYVNYPYAQGSPPGQQYGGQQYAYPYQAPIQPDPFQEAKLEAAKLSQLSGDAVEVWEALDGVKELTPDVRLQAVLNHAVQRFSTKFGAVPDLDLLVDALHQGASNATKAMKQAELGCKMCVSDPAAAGNRFQKRHISFLTSHFKLIHGRDLGAALDWTTNMIEPPELKDVSRLIRAVGMDDDKLALLAAAFPQAFPHPLPRIGLIREPSPDVGPDSGLASRLVAMVNKKPRKPQSKKKNHVPAGSLTPARSDSSHEPPAENEYDPRRPMLMQNQDPADNLSRYDTDVARKASTRPSETNLGSSSFSLTSETLAQLQNLPSAPGQAQQPLHRDRSPSVGRAEAESSVAKTLGSLPTVAPADIGALLAKLTALDRPQAVQTATPTTARPESGPRHEPAVVYAQPQQKSQRSPSAYRDERAPAPAPPPIYRASAEPPGRYESHDYHASLLRNTARYEQNRAPSYSERPTYASAPQAYSPTYYEDPQRQPQARQYQATAPAPPMPRYQQYEPPPTRTTVYVDQYGQPVHLIPIDSAPAPVQYLPHPSEHQPREPYARHPETIYEPVPREERRQVYYEHAPPPPPPPSHVPQGQVHYEQAPPPTAYAPYGYEHAPAGNAPPPTQATGRYSYH